MGAQENHKLISEMYTPKKDEDSITSRNSPIAANDSSIIVIT